LGGDRRSSLLRRRSGLLDCDGDDRDVMFGDTLAGDESKVGSKEFEKIGRIEHVRLSADLDLGKRLEQGDRGVLGLLAAFGGGGFEGRADLRVAEVVRLSALAIDSAAGTEGVMMEYSGDLSVGEVEGSGRGDGREGKSAKKGGILYKRLVLVRDREDRKLEWWLSRTCAH
jgi:hypothetical protein